MSASAPSPGFRIFLRLYGRIAPYRISFAFTALLVIALAFLSPVRPEQMRSIVDQWVPAGNHDQVFRVSLLFIAVLLLEALIQFVQALLANRVAQAVTLDLRADLYAHVMRFKTSYFDRTPVGQFVTRLVGDIDGIAEVFSVGILDIARDALKLV
ncbi:MAG: ABC transporter transmembrane domain-containing protein, partial [Bacteroidota bacterium]